MEFLEFHWLYDQPTLKSALQDTFGSSGQLLKRHFSSKELARPIRAKDFAKIPLELANHLEINPKFVGTRPQILLETKDYLVLHKPAGVHCHPLNYADQDTLLNFLVEEKKWDALNVNRENYDRGLMWRLDLETSGVIMVAKNAEFHQQLRQNFNSNMKAKFYLAVVNGDFNCDGQQTHYFQATGIKGSKQKTYDDPKGDAAEGNLWVKKLAYQNEKSLLLVKLETGLRHQIRAQLAHLGFAILGDELYGGRKAERLFLHAWRYEWGDNVIEDARAELFDRFFDLNTSLKMAHDVLGNIKRS